MTTPDAAAVAAVALPFALAGGAWGLVADRLAARWPRHADGSVRSLGLRSVAVVVTSAIAMGALPLRVPGPFLEDLPGLAILAAWFAALVVLMAIDLDQRLLPDTITLPLIPAALIVLVAGWNPLLADKEMGVVSGIAAAALAPAFLGVTNWLFRGGLGMGDVKLSVSLGLVLGISRFITGFFAGALVFAIVALALLATRRIGLRSAIPFGPMLVLAGLAGALMGTDW